MKYYKRLKVYKASNVTFNPETKEAYSYSWWKFVTKVNGLVVFNDHTYSISTRKHQSKVWRLLEYKADLIVDTHESLNSSSWKESALRTEYRKLFEFQVMQSNPRRRNDFSNDIKYQLDRIELVKKALKVTLPQETIEFLKNLVIEREIDRINEEGFKSGSKLLDKKAPNVQVTSGWQVPEQFRNAILSKDNFNKLVQNQVLPAHVRTVPTYEDTSKVDFNIEFHNKFESKVLK